VKFNPFEEFLFLLASVGPLRVTIVCAAMTADAPPEFLKKVALRSVLTAAIVCLVFVMIGEAILHLFNVSVPALQIGGGIIVLRASLEMVMGETGDKSDHGPGAKGGEPSPDIATYPLAIPMMASVSGLVAIVSLVAQDDSLRALSFLTIAIVAIMALNYLCLRSCRYLVRAVGPGVLVVIGKVMGIILAALAVELTLAGLINLGIVAKPAATTTDAAASTKVGMIPRPSSFARGRAWSRPGHSPDPIVPENPISEMATAGLDSHALMQAATAADRARFEAHRRGLGRTEGARGRSRASWPILGGPDVRRVADEGRGCPDRVDANADLIEDRLISGRAGSGWRSS
jgi:multiple antibiotic resistance protein